MKTILIKLASKIIFAFLAVLIISSTMNAQDLKFRSQAWRFGLNAAMQSNSAALGWQQLHGTDPNFQSPPDDIDLVDGTGTGAYFGLFGEYLSESWWGVQMRVSYDVRNALVIDDTYNPNPSFDTKMSYLTFEPLFRVDQLIVPYLNFYIGPIIAVNLNGSYIYMPDKDGSTEEPETDVDGLSKLTYGLQGGLGYDFRVHDFDELTSLYITPFFDMSWLVNQKETGLNTDQNAIADIWSTLSYRFGVRLSYETREPVDSKGTAMEPARKANVYMPDGNTIYTKNVKGYFPIHPYVFFDKGSSKIPPRYLTLNAADARNFKEADLEDFTKGELTIKETNVTQLMVSYYNVMNIYGDRMRNNPKEKLVLTSSNEDDKLAAANADAVKKYLVENFSIDSNRISIKIEPPSNPSGSATTEAESQRKIADENRRVGFVFTNKKMSEPLQYNIRDESSIDNDLIFSIGKDVPYKSWDITITGEDRTMYFGPYIYNYERINPAELMRFLESGNYNARVMITDKDGLKTEENIPFKLNREKGMKNADRYLMLFEYNQANAISSYEEKIRKEIVPGMEVGNRVYVHGHTDDIGTAAGNRELSLERANKAKAIIDDQLKKDDKLLNVQAIGVGQSKMQYSFDNRLPEGRMYNRNIFVEISK